jgi:hypothetical protein
VNDELWAYQPGFCFWSHIETRISSVDAERNSIDFYGELSASRINRTENISAIPLK